MVILNGGLLLKNFVDCFRNECDLLVELWAFMVLRTTGHFLATVVIRSRDPKPKALTRKQTLNLKHMHCYRLVKQS